MLIFPLKKEWYEKIRSGEKTVEYREVKPYWTRRIERYLDDCVSRLTTSQLMEELFNHGHPIKFMLSYRDCVLRLGYTKRQMTADITKIGVVDGKDTDLRVDKPVYAIHLANVREN